MNFDKWALRARTDERGQWLPLYDYELRGHDAAHYLTEMSLQNLDHAHVLRFALEGRLPLVVNIPTGTKDVEGRPMDAGALGLGDGGGRETRD